MIYYTAWNTANLLLRGLLRYRKLGVEHVPKQGGVILASNHQSFLDPLLVGCGSPRLPVYFMARESLFRFPLWGWFLRKVYAFPVRRGGADRAAWRRFEELVGMGKVVCFFPEGTRSPDGELQPAHPGAGMLIHRCKGATVVPVRVFGAHKVLPKGRFFGGLHPVQVAFGPPVDLKEECSREGSRDLYQAIADKVMKAIANIQPGAVAESAAPKPIR